jgi:hypothetical protein
MTKEGRVQSLHTREMTITHNSGDRMVVNRPDRSVIVTNRAGHGYVQRPFNYRGQELVHRTYYVRGAPYARYYRSFGYRGVMLYGYVPVRYYSPGFYGWAYNPWAAPVSYSWGWDGSPWLGLYGGYFAPSPFYRSPSLWLTDFVISQQLMTAYQEQSANVESGQQQNFAGSNLAGTALVGASTVGGLPQDSVALTFQMRAIPKSALKAKIRSHDEGELEELKLATDEALGRVEPHLP